MKQHLHNLKHEADKLHLSHAEKSAMRASIFGSPSPLPSPAPSPYFFFNWQFVQTRVLAPLMVVLLVGSGTAYAAEGALPGDTLYPVKIYVNESVAVQLATTPVKKAEVHTKLAERRVAEAQELAAEGRLDGATTEALAADIEVHAEVAEAEATTADEEESGKGRELKARLAVTLEAGGAVLAELGKDTDEPSKENAGNLAVRVIARADGSAAANARNTFAKAQAASAPAATMSLMAADSGVEGMPQEDAEDPTAQKAAASVQLKAASALTEVQELFAEINDSLSDSTKERIEKQLSAIEVSMSVGAATVGAGGSADAEEHFTDALRGSIRLQKLLEAYQKYDHRRIAPLFGDHDSNDTEEGEVRGEETEQEETPQDKEEGPDEQKIIDAPILRAL